MRGASVTRVGTHAAGSEGPSTGELRGEVGHASRDTPASLLVAMEAGAPSEGDGFTCAVSTPGLVGVTAAVPSRFASLSTSNAVPAERRSW